MHASIYRLRLQDILTVCVIGLLFLGVVMVQSAAMNVTGQAHWRLNDQGFRHLIFASIAFITFLAVGQIDYRRFVQRGVWTHLAMALGALAIIGACVAVLIPHVEREINGARRWLPLGFTQVQPSELAKWGMVVFMAWWLVRQPIKVQNFFGFILTLVPVGAICLLVVIEDFGTAALIALGALAICLVGRIKLWHLLVIIPPVLMVGVWFIFHKSYRRARMLAFLDPFASPEREGYHMIQSLLSFASGGIFGRGLGRGIQKLGYLPEDTTDFIFAVICEELGLFGALLVIALYLGIIYVAWQAVKQRKNSFGQLLAFGMGAMIGLQALINIAVATVSVPPKGMSLPLVSAGGSGLVITCAALGLLYSVCRQEDEEVDLAGEPSAPPAAADPPPVAAPA